MTAQSMASTTTTAPMMTPATAPLLASQQSPVCLAQHSPFFQQSDFCSKAPQLPVKAFSMGQPSSVTRAKAVGMGLLWTNGTHLPSAGGRRGGDGDGD